MIFALALIVFVAFVVQATAGFGAGLLVLSLGALFWPISELVVLVASLSILFSLYICSRHFRHIHFGLLLRSILPIMCAGVAVGFLLTPHASPNGLRLLLGMVVIAAAARGFYALFATKVVVVKQGGPAADIWVGFAGILHGLMATGGPALVYGIEALGLGKSSFRASLAFLFLVANTTLILRFAVTGGLGSSEVGRIAALVPVVVAATFTGEVLHSRVSERGFRAIVFVLLAVAGLLLWLPLLLG